MKATNASFDWDTFNAPVYNAHNYGGVLREDIILGKAAISALTDLGIPLGSLRKGIDICNGGGVRGPSYIAPLMHESGSILWADIGKTQLQMATEMIEKGRRRTLGHWGNHQRQMAECHRAWQDATFRACALSEAAELSVFDLPENSFDIATTSFGPESLTQDPDEWILAMDRLYLSLKHNGIALIFAMIGSTGYSTSGPRMPALPITVHDLIKVASPWLSDIRLTYVHSLGDMRREDDPDTYEGTAMLVGLRK
jgi:hypothetical protein